MADRDPSPQAVIRAQVQAAVREAKEQPRELLTIRVSPDLRGAVLQYCTKRRFQSHLEQADAINELLLYGIMTVNHLASQEKDAAK